MKVIPKLKRSSVKITYGSEDGFSANMTIGNDKKDPKQAILVGAYELARIAELIGCSDELQNEVNKAQNVIRKFKKDNGYQ